MTRLTLICNNCKKSMSLQEVKFLQPAIFTNQFFQFVEVDTEIPEEVQTNGIID
jgi:hypothetical protein